MIILQNLLRESIIWSETLCAIIAILYYKKVKNTYWKWFCFYLVFILISELFSKYGIEKFSKTRLYYFDFFIIPIEFIFFFWLYCYKSLDKKRIFWICMLFYMISYLPHLFFLDEMRLINSLSYTIGCLFLMVLAFLEFRKQIADDNILNYKQNKMFYVNIAIIIFYVGTLPFFAFDKYLFENFQSIRPYYYTFFLFACNLMYLLFAASFIWGKPNS